MNNCQTVRYLPVFPMSDLNNKLSLNKKCPSVDPKILSSKRAEISVVLFTKSLVPGTQVD